MKALVTMALGTLLSCGITSTAAAQIHRGDGSVTLFGGVYTFNEFQGDADPIFGIRGSGFLTDYVGLEASVEVVPTGEGVTVLGYQGNIVIHLAPHQRAVPFLTGGVGGITFTGGGDSETRLAGNVGVGLKAFVSERVALRFEARDRIYRILSDTLNDFYFTAGVEFIL